MKTKITKFDRELVKACHLNPGLTPRDYVMEVLYKESFDVPVKEFIDIKNGDMIAIISFKWKSKKHQARARKQTEKIFNKFRQK